MKLLSIILPTFNERDNVTKIYEKLKETITPLELDYEIIFVDDDSSDCTIEEIKKLQTSDSKVKYILMSRRYGDQISLIAGIDHSLGDAVVIMDSDLQHPPHYIAQMVSNWKMGYDIVIMKRKEAGHTSFFKKWSEIFFYKVMKTLSKTPIHFRFSGFALIDRRAVDALKKYQDKEPFVRGLIGIIGFKIAEVEYIEDERKEGQSKYNVLSMLRLAILGITSFSVVPLYASFYMGLIVVFFSFLYAFIVLIEKVMHPDIPIGWTSIIISVTILSGIQLISIGLLGIYISKIYIESKNRPRYIIAESKGIHE
jgi:polyisoprenyl-phosphate glycosyltransferase